MSALSDEKYLLTTPWPTRSPRQLTNVATDSPVRTGLPRRGRFTRERLQPHLAIINFMADYFRPGTSGDIHLKYILLVHINFLKTTTLPYSVVIYSRRPCGLVYINVPAGSLVRAGLQRRGRLSPGAVGISQRMRS